MPMTSTDNLLVTLKTCWSLYWSFSTRVYSRPVMANQNPKVLFLNKTLDFEVETFEKDGRTDEI